MPRIQPVTAETKPESADILNGVKKKMGKVPNIIGTMANSPAVAKSYLNFSGAMAESSLPAELREQVALTVGQTNNCNYCISAHSYLGHAAGLSDDQVLAARKGQADDPKRAAGLAFAKQVVDKQGFVSDGDMTEVREAGYSDQEIAELVALVALNIFTNYFNHVTDPEIDFPVAADL